MWLCQYHVSTIINSDKDVYFIIVHTAYYKTKSYTYSVSHSLSNQSILSLSVKVNNPHFDTRYSTKQVVNIIPKGQFFNILFKKQCQVLQKCRCCELLRGNHYSLRWPRNYYGQSVCITFFRILLKDTVCFYYLFNRNEEQKLLLCVPNVPCSSYCLEEDKRRQILLSVYYNKEKAVFMLVFNSRSTHAYIMYLCIYITR